MGRIDKELEKLFPQCCVGRFYEGTTTRNAGEGFELARSEELDVPVLDAGALEARFAVGAEVDFDVLRDRRIEICAVARGVCVHPFLNGGGGEVTDTVCHGGFETCHKLRNDSVFVRGIHRIGTAHHEDEVDIELKGFEPSDEFSNVSRMRRCKERNLHTGRLHGRGRHDLLHAGNRCEGSVCVAWQTSVGVRDEAADELEMGWNDAEFDVGFDLDGGGHNGVRGGLGFEKDARHPRVEGFAERGRFQLKCRLAGQAARDGFAIGWAETMLQKGRVFNAGSPLCALLSS